MSIKNRKTLKTEQLHLAQIISCNYEKTCRVFYFTAFVLRLCFCAVIFNP